MKADSKTTPTFSLDGWDFRIDSFDGWTLVLVGETYPNCPLDRAEFSGVSYIQCPSNFSHATFRLATATECEHIQTLVPLESEDKVLAIDAETGAGLDSHTFFIVAEEMRWKTLVGKSGERT